MAITRRRFLQHGLTVVAAGVAVPPWLQELAQADPIAPLGSPAGVDDRILVVLQFSGGNDGLNTVVPYASPQYRLNRPTIGVSDTSVLHLDDAVGFHPNLQGVKGLYDQGKVAVVQGVGYPHPNRSHFRSMEIWHTAVPERVERYGWIGRYLDTSPALYHNSLAGINIGVEAPKAVQAEHAAVLSVSDVARFGLVSSFGYASRATSATELLKEIESSAGGGMGAPGSAESLVQQTTLDAFKCADQIRDGVKKYHSQVEYPEKNPVATGFQQVAKLIAAGLGTRIYYVSTGGFDTHSREKEQHDLLMQHIGDAVAAFWKDLEGMGAADRVTIMTFSEFGRRVHENAGGGTDHGTAGPMLLIGGKVKGGVYGGHPSLTDLDHGDLKYNVDFRSMYATVLAQWLNTDPTRVLGAAYPHLDVLNT